MLQSWDRLQAYALTPFRFIQRFLTKVRRSRNLEVTLVAPFWLLRPWFPDLLELLVEVPVLLPQRKDLLRQPHYHQNLPSARSDWVSHCQRSARHFGFSSSMARQLAFCRRPSMRLNYQSKCNTYRAWCRSRGHSVSRPSIPKV